MEAGNVYGAGSIQRQKAKGERGEPDVPMKGQGSLSAETTASDKTVTDNIPDSLWPPKSSTPL